MTVFRDLAVWYNGQASEQIEVALTVFEQTIHQRSDIAIDRRMDLTAGEVSVMVTLEENLASLKSLAEAPSDLFADLDHLPRPGSEGYRLASRGATILVSGADERGVLYGLGRLLRILEIRSESVTLPRPLSLSSTPRAALRGHQLGYRPKTNAYDMWSKDQYLRYIQDLALFGANAIELMPPRTDDESRTPEMLHDQLEMMAWLSGAIHSLGLDVWIWYPNMGENFTDPETLASESAEREEVYSALPHVDAVMIPGGDPGHQEPAVLFEWGRIQSEILRHHHPEAQMWISAQVAGSTPSWLGAFLRELGREPEWLSGVSHGPWVKGDVAEFRASVPPRYPIRRYPDITHSLSCQYPVRDWDPAFAATLGRECYNPRPLDHKTIHNAYVDHAVGSLSYSEGINDDVNKFIWSDQDWDPSTPVKETLRDFGRLFISPDYVEEIAEGLLGLERNWRGPIVSNQGIGRTFSLWKDLEKQLPSSAESNYRLVMPLVRVYYDEYIRRRLHRERGLEERVVSIIQQSRAKDIDDAMSGIKTLIEQSTAGAEFDYLKTHCIELADRAFNLIRWQTSVVRHKGQAVVRGCFLDAIDFQISDLPFYAQAVSAAEKASGAAEKWAVLRQALDRARPSTSGVFVDTAQDDMVVKDRCWKDDPSGLSLPVTVNIPAPWPSYDVPGKLRGEENPVIPVVERSYVASFFCKPLMLRFADLDPLARYQVRVCYRSHRPWGGIRLAAGGWTIHDYITPDGEQATMIFPLPAGSVDAAGRLELIWQARPFRVYSEGLAWVAIEPCA